MSTKKTTTAKAPAKTAAKAKPETKTAAKAAPAPKKPETKPAATAPELTPFQKLFVGLPKNPKECTAEQVKSLQTAYAKVKAELTEAEQGKVREYGVAATNHLKSAAAKPAAKAEVTDKEIQNLINEMNTVMDLEPIIVFGEDHMNRITTEAKDLREQDFDCSRPTCFTSNATTTFRKLGIVLPGEKAAAKAAKAKAPKVPGAKRTSSPRTSNGAPCSKSVVYLAWKKGNTDADKLSKLAGVSAQLVTVKSWLSAWKNGKNLPAIAAQSNK